MSIIWYTWKTLKGAPEIQEEKASILKNQTVKCMERYQDKLRFAKMESLKKKTLTVCESIKDK